MSNHRRDRQLANRPQEDPHTQPVQPAEILALTRTTTGPLPSPEILAQYDKVVPGAALRIIEMAEAQAKHRRELERTQMEANVSIARQGLQLDSRGQLFGFIIAITGLGAAAFTVYLVPNGYGVAAAAAFGGVPLASLIYAYMHGRKPDSKPSETSQSTPR